MTEELLRSLLDAIKKMPSVIGAEPFSFVFCNNYINKNNEKSYHILLMRYANKTKKNFSQNIEMLLETDRKDFLDKINLSELKSFENGKNKIYIGYKPQAYDEKTLGIMGQNIYLIAYKNYLSYEFYTTIKDDAVFTIFTDDKKNIELIRFNKLKIDSKIIKLCSEMPDILENFIRDFVRFYKKDDSEYLSFYYVDQQKRTKISVEIILNKLIGKMIKRSIRNKKTINSFFLKGTIGGKDILFTDCNEHKAIFIKLGFGDINLMYKFAKKLFNDEKTSKLLAWLNE